MVHARITDQGHVDDIGALDFRCPCHLCHDSIETIDDGIVQDLQTIWIGHGVADSGHDILTVNDLRIHHRSGRHDRTIYEITEVARHRGGPYIHRQTIGRLYKARLYFDDFFALPDGNGHLPLALAHNIL